jgi:lipopolysaccharide export system protein LptA
MFWFGDPVRGRRHPSASMRLLQCGLLALAALGPRIAGAQEPAPGDETLSQPIRVYSKIAYHWSSGEGRVGVLLGPCRIQQGELKVESNQMVIWLSSFHGRERLEVYAEGAVRVSRPNSTRSPQYFTADLWTQSGVGWNADKSNAYETTQQHPILKRAIDRRRMAAGQLIKQTQLVVPDDGLDFRSFRLDQQQGPLRRVRLYSRTGQQFSFQTERNTDVTPHEQIGTISGGVKLNVDSPTADGTPDPRAVELAADNMVIWTEATELTDLRQGGEELQTRDKRFQIYLEGNIVIRQGDYELRAQRAFYDARENRALLSDAELKIWLPNAESWLRVRAGTIRQVAEGYFHAQNAWMSGSYFGDPSYRVEATDIFLEPRVINPWVKAQGGWVDPVTGEVDDGEIAWMTTLGNRFVLGRVPFFYTPYLSGPAEDPHLPIQRASFEQDRVFGLRSQTAWDPFHLFAMDKPEELSASLLIEHASRRGLGVGLESAYDATDPLGIVGKTSGESHIFYQHDKSDDNLGLDRRSLRPDDKNRGRIFLRHRHDFPFSISMFGEVGYLSDRNFYEQWYENDFDRFKDHETRVSIEQRLQNFTGRVLVQPQVNDFENVTEWYPRGDLFALGEPIPGTPILWTMHSSAGYANLNPAVAPTKPGDTFTALPYVANVGGVVTMSRHELSLPMNLGPAIFAPYVMGEAAYWDEELTGQDLNRLVGTAGVRGSLSMWKVFPFVRSTIFNLSGLAHKMTFDFDYSITDSSEDIGRIAQYNDLDDNAQERFRQRFPVNTFGGAVPAVLNPRQYAIRSGAGSLVSAPWHELVDDLHVLRFGWHHRLQTKVGPPERQRIRDWMTLDLDAAFFPNQMENFGDDFGLYSARYSWLLSERTTIVANALYDSFDGGQQLWNAGVISQRSARGSTYLGVRQVKARGFDSQILTASASYLMSPKWVGTASTAFDIAEGQNRGQSFTLTRIGADFLVHVGTSYDRSKDSVGIALSLEPRFGPRTPYSSQMSSLLGLDR